MVLRAKGPAPTGVAVSRVLWFSESPWGAPELGLPAPPSEVLTTGSVSASQTREVYQYWWGTRFSETSGALGGGGHPGGGGSSGAGSSQTPGPGRAATAPWSCRAERRCRRAVTTFRKRTNFKFSGGLCILSIVPCACDLLIGHL